MEKLTHLMGQNEVKWSREKLEFYYARNLSEKIVSGNNLLKIKLSHFWGGGN